jgi:hypothetical protein
VSLYNILHGVDPDAEALLAHLGTTRGAVPRFRDCYIEDGKICLYTRMGGGNRGHWDMYETDPGANCDCPGCIAERYLPTLPGYLYNEDDDWDSTYANYYYALPASADTLPKGQDAKQGLAGTESGAVPKADAQPKSGQSHAQ